MNKAEKAYRELLSMDRLSSMDSPMHRLHPLSKLAATAAYILITVSFHKYDVFALFVMLLFPVAAYQFALIPIRTCFQKLWLLLPIVCAVGLLNPLFDRSILFYVGTVPVSGGVVSFITLMLKGIFCLLASFLFAATTPTQALCHALRKIHVPKLICSLLLLTFRYAAVLLEEAAIMTDAYHLRSPRQKGIHFSAWGSFLGQMLLRSTDRAEALYESMRLRGYDGEFDYCGREYKNTLSSAAFALISIAAMLLVRYYDPR